MDSNKQERLLDMDVHAAATILPLMKDKDFNELVASIRASKGNKEPIVRHGNVLLDGRNRARAIEALRAEGVEVKPLFREWDSEKDGPPVAFIWRVNYDRRHLTPDQRVAGAAQFLPLLQAEAEDRQRQSQIQKGERRNPLGRRGNPENREGSKPPLSPEEKVKRSREKDERSAAGRIAKTANVSLHKAKQVQQVIKHCGKEVLASVSQGEKKLSELLPKKEKNQHTVPGVGDPAFTTFVGDLIQRVIDRWPINEHRDVRKAALEKLKADQAKFDGKQARVPSGDNSPRTSNGIPLTRLGRKEGSAPEGEESQPDRFAAGAI